MTIIDTISYNQFKHTVCIKCIIFKIFHNVTVWMDDKENNRCGEMLL